MEQRQGDAAAPVISNRNGGNRGRLLLLGLMSLVVVIATVGYALTRGDDDGGTGQDADEALPTPHSITRDGVTYEIGLASPAGASTDAGNLLAVTVYALDIESPDDPDCSWIDPQARVVAETPDEVRIATFDYSTRADADEGERMCGYSTTNDSASMYKAMELRLAQPLGDRRLVDERSGDVIGVLDARYSPSPRYIPDGYEQTLVMHFTPEDGFVALRQFRDRASGSSLEVHVRSATAWSLSGRVIAEDEVAAAEATVTEEDHQRCVSWSPRPGLVAEVCSLTEFLGPGELLRIARSIPPVG